MSNPGDEIAQAQWTHEEVTAAQIKEQGIVTVQDRRFSMIRSDQTIADELKAKAIKAIDDLNAICTEADRQGFRIVFQQAQDGIGRFFTQTFMLLKKMG
jgi:hypothetical protein